MVVLDESELILFYLKENLQRLRAVGSGIRFDVPRFEPQTLAPEAKSTPFTQCPVSIVLYKCICSYVP